jgi:iron complex transport system substrate-binding protein
LGTALPGLLLGALLLAGCGQGQDTTAAPAPATSQAPASAAAGTFPATVQAGNGTVTVPARPERIVSLSPTATETLFAIGAGPQVVAVDDQSDFPAQAPRTDLSGFKPNAEAIIAQKPDLVVLANDIGGIVAAQTKVGVTVLVEPAATKLDESYDQVNDLGVATGNAAKAKEVADGMKRQLDELVAAAPKEKKLTYYHELDSTPYSVTSSTFIGQVYGLFGLENIADGADKASGGYPQLSQEYLLRRDPNMILLADTKCCGQSAVAVGKRPGWSDLTAIQKKNTVELDDDIASRWGPRLPDFVKAIAAAVQKASAAK